MFSFFVLIFIISITIAVPAQESGPLLLTPYIERNNIQEARQASTVNPEIFLNVTSYSGFLTVDKRYNSNLFFWYFPNVARNVSKTPWIIWLQGGPGGTSLAGLFGEMGPFEYVNDTLKLREYTWCIEYSMVFIDNPVGAGFSFTDYEDGYSRTMDMYTENLYNAVKQLASLYPELGHAPLYLAGESYAGRYVPALAAKIAEGRRTDNNINLQGIMLGNPILDRNSLVDYTRVFYNWGLIDSQGALAAEPLQEEFEQAVNGGDSERAYKLRDEILTKLSAISNHDELYNVLSDDNIVSGVKKFIPYIEKPAIRQAIHVGNQSFTFDNWKAGRYLIGDFLYPVSQKVEMLLENYKVLIYCGQLDLTTPCVLNAEGRRKKWQWSGRGSFLKAQRYPWWFNNAVAGYVKSGGNFTEVLVTRAGHMVPIEKPAETKLLVSSFIRGVDLNEPPAYKPHEEVTYQEYRDLNHHSTTDYKTGLIASVVINVLLVVGIVLGVLIFLKWKRHYDIVPFSDSVLSLT